MSTKENKELVRCYLSVDADEIKRDSTRGKDNYHAPEFKLHSSMGDMSLKEYLQVNDTVVAAFPDCKYNAEDIVAEGDKVAARYTFTGTHKGAFLGIPPTGKKVKTEGMGIFKIAGGRIAEAWFIADQMNLMQQLGVIPKR